MTDIAVFYKSRYGSTKKYAQWIAEDLGADLYALSPFSAGKLKRYSTIIFGGGIYTNKILKIDFIIKNYRKIAEKKIIVFSCGLTSPNFSANTERIQKGLREQSSEEIMNKIKLFHLHGGLNHSKLHFYHRFLMKMLLNMLKGKREEDISDEEQNMLETLGSDQDFVDRDSIKPIVECALNKEV